MILKAEEVFQEIAGDPDNVMMNIPEEICKQAGFEIGDEIVIESKDGSLVLFKKEKPAKIYESPDGGKTVYARDFGMDPRERVLVKKNEK